MRNRAAVWSWALYDFANTIFYGIVVTAFLPNYVIEKCGGSHLPYALAFYPSMIVAALFAPALGELADRTGRARVLTFAFTAACCAGAAALALPEEPLPILALFALALIAYQCALVFYNTLLPAVAAPEELGLVSGLGVGLGYLGNLFALLLAYPLYEAMGRDPRLDFVLAGVLTLAFSLPLWWWCRTPPVPRPASASFGALVRENVGATARLLRRLPRNRPLLLFFAGNFLCADVLNCVYAYLVPYVAGEHGLGSEAKWVLFATNFLAFPAALALGRLADRGSERRVMIGGAVCLLASIAVPQALIELARASLLPEVLAAGERWRALGSVAVAVFGALGVGGVLGAARKWLVRLVPAGEVGAWFGIYGLTNKASLLSLGAFALLADRAGGRYTFSVAFLAILLVLAIALLARAPEGQRPELSR